MAENKRRSCREAHTKKRFSSIFSFFFFFCSFYSTTKESRRKEKSSIRMIIKVELFSLLFFVVLLFLQKERKKKEGSNAIKQTGFMQFTDALSPIQTSPLFSSVHFFQTSVCFQRRGEMTEEQRGILTSKSQ